MPSWAEKEDAIREGRRAVELKPETKDATDGAIMNCCLALIYARIGENDSRDHVDRAIAPHARRRRQRELQHHRERSEVSLGMGPVAFRSRLSETRFRTLICQANGSNRERRRKRRLLESCCCAAATTSVAPSPAKYFWTTSAKTVISLRVTKAKLVWQNLNDLPNLGRLLLKVHVKVRTAGIPTHVRITLRSSLFLSLRTHAPPCPAAWYRVEAQKSVAPGGGRRSHLQVPTRIFSSGRRCER